MCGDSLQRQAELYSETQQPSKLQVVDNGSRGFRDVCNELTSEVLYGYHSEKCVWYRLGPREMKICIYTKTLTQRLDEGIVRMAHDMIHQLAKQREVQLLLENHRATLTSVINKGNDASHPGGGAG